jgi:Nidogen-like
MNTFSKNLECIEISAESYSNLPTKFIGYAVTSLLISLAMTGAASAAAIRTGFSSNTLAANDDGSSAATALGFTANFFGTNYTQTYVNNNGNLTFTAPLGTFTPFGLAGANTPIIAPFFADVDTRGTGSVTYGTGTVDGFNAFAATYTNVGYFNSQIDKTNSFQVVLISRPDTNTPTSTGNFDIEFNYDKIQWETGSASGGANGLGGSPARAGYSNGLSGAANVSLELRGSNVSGAFLDGGSNSLVANSLNSNISGQDLFSARNGQVVIASPTTAVPEPFTIVGTLMGAATAFRMRKRLKVTNEL